MRPSSFACAALVATCCAAGCATVLGYGDEVQLGAPVTATDGGTDADAEAGGGAGVFVAVGYGGRRVMSRDGLAWENDTFMPDASTSSYLNAVAFGGARFVAVAYDRYTSSDGVTWERHEPRLPQWLGGIAYGRGRWVGVGGYGWRAVSDNGVDWADSAGATLYRDGYDAVVFGDYGGGRFVAHSESGRLSLSDDGDQWTEVSGAGVSALTWGNGVFVGVGGKSVRRSTDGGATWTTKATANVELDSIAWGNGRFVAIGNDRSLVSEDGVTWKESIAPGARGIIAFGGGHFVACADGACHRSDDGVAWKKGTLPASTYSLKALCYGAR